MKSTIRSGRYPCPKCGKKGVCYAIHAHASGWKDYSKAVCRYCKFRFNIKTKQVSEAEK